MKTIYRILVLFGLLAVGTACSEDSLSPEYEYNGPIPAIADGPSEAQKICYELYQKLINLIAFGRCQAILFFQSLAFCLANEKREAFNHFGFEIHR